VSLFPFINTGDVCEQELAGGRAGDLHLGRWGEVQQGNFFVLASASFKDIGVIHRSLQHSLAGDLQLGRWGEVQQGDFCVLAFAYILVTWSI
jgi:hypothetical protein